MRVLITGSDGFIAKNLRLHLSERPDIHVLLHSRENSLEELACAISDVDYIFHLAGVNRPDNTEDYFVGNEGFTDVLCKLVLESGCRPGILYSSSIQAELDNPYGRSKLAAEQSLLSLSRDYDIPVTIFRLPNVFGKWAKPNYNSVVATFCNNIATDKEISINDGSALINLVYVDDVVEHFIELIDGKRKISPYDEVGPRYDITVGHLAEQLYKFKDSRKALITEPVGRGLTRALYSTYLSYLPKESFNYEIPKYEDSRGIFVEMLKTPDAGQFSFFSARPGITRGGHYHHTKTEKFLVIKGAARFKFRHMYTREYFELDTNGNKPEIVETVPGWTHDITNVGDDEMVVMLWANEIFDREKPDTYTCPLSDTD